MASVLIHMAVAKKINEELKRDERNLLLGSIVPDIGKSLNISRKVSHFTNGISDTPNVNLFYDKYKTNLNNDYELGYFIHLLTDELWFEEFMKNYMTKDGFILKNGEQIDIKEEEYFKLLYNDYTNLDPELLDYYNMDLSIFYDEYEFPINAIEEIPYNKLRRLLDEKSLIYTKNSKTKEYILSLENITLFIEYSAIYVMDKLREYKVI